MGRYVQASDVTAEGASGASATKINARIAKWEGIVDRLTNNYFAVLEPGELTFDGNNSRILHFNIPLIEVTSLKINDEDTDLDAEEYRVFNGTTPIQDDRHNPKIELKGITKDSIFRKTRALFIKGLDQKVIGKWGYVDPDGSGGYETPAAIKDAVVRLVILDLEGFFAQQMGAGGAAISPVKRERTDDHEVEYQQTEPIKVTWTMLPRDVYDVLMLYRAPWKMDSPDPRIFRSVIDINRVLAF